MIRLAPLALAAALAATGCGSKIYTVPNDELQRLAGRAPEARADYEAVRAVQGGPLDASDEANACRQHEEMPPRAAVSTARIDEAPVTPSGAVHRRVHHHHHHHHRVVRPMASAPPAPPPGRAARPRPAARRSSGSSRSSRGSLNYDIEAAKGIAAVVIAVAAIGTLAAVAVEASRFDGWLDLPPEHPVHLVDGERHATVALADLQPADIGPGTRGLVRLDDGEQAERAPLDREGLVWRMELGSMGVLTPDGGDPSTFQGTMQLGWFMHQRFGLAATASLGWGTYRGGHLLAARYGLEAQALPLQVGPLHLGAYGMGGAAYNARDDGDLSAGDSQRLLVGVGLLSEIELSTRLALSMRLGTNWRPWHRTGFERPAVVASVGFALY